MDGKLNEFLLFVALQMACRADDGKTFPDTRSVADMVQRMWDYLSPAEPEPPPSEVVEEVMEDSGYRTGDSAVNLSPTGIKYSYGIAGKDDENHIKDLHKTTMMPWLVPACSHGKLKAKCEEQTIR